MGTILVTGATGKLGSAVIEALVVGGINVRAATRKTTGIKWTKLVQPVVFDYEDPGLHKAALDGITGLFLIAPPLDFEAPAKRSLSLTRPKRCGSSMSFSIHICTRTQMSGILSG